MRKLALSLSVVLLFLTVACGFTVGAASSEPPGNLKSKAIYLYNLDTETLVYEKNCQQIIYPASLTKIMSTIVALENVKDLDAETVTAEPRMFDEFKGINISNAGIEIGETLTIRQLLHCMMIQSANEAANMVAYYVGGGDREKFIEMMNKKAEEIGTANTHFVNPHGLHDLKHYTTAEDMFKITKYAMSVPGFMELATKTSYELPATNKSGPRTLFTTNLMTVENSAYYYPYAKGIKTGTTDEAGRCLISTAKNGGFNYLLVVMGAPYKDAEGKILNNQAFIESKKIYKWAFETFTIKSIVKPDTTIGEIKVNLSQDKDHVLLSPKEEFTALIPNNIDPSSVQKIQDVPESIDAPVQKGQVVGTLTMMLAGKEIGTVQLVAAEDVERSQMLYIMDFIQSVLHSLWFKIAACVIAALVVLYIVLILVNRSRRKKRRVIKHRKF